MTDDAGLPAQLATPSVFITSLAFALKVRVQPITPNRLSFLSFTRCRKMANNSLDRSERGSRHEFGNHGLTNELHSQVDSVRHRTQNAGMAQQQPGAHPQALDFSVEDIYASSIRKAQAEAAVAGITGGLIAEGANLLDQTARQFGMYHPFTADSVRREGRGFG